MLMRSSCRPNFLYYLAIRLPIDSFEDYVHLQVPIQEADCTGRRVGREGRNGGDVQIAISFMLVFSPSAGEI